MPKWIGCCGHNYILDTDRLVDLKPVEWLPWLQTIQETVVKRNSFCIKLHICTWGEAGPGHVTGFA